MSQKKEIEFHSSVAKSLYETGYINIQLPEELTILFQSLFKLASIFFQQDEEYKSKTTDAQFGTGYSLINGEKELFQVRMGSNMKWPEDDKNFDAKLFKELTTKLFALLDEQCRKYLKEILSENCYENCQCTLDPTVEEILKDDKSSSILDFCHYFNRVDGKSLPCNSHTDFGLMTFCVENELGLQIYVPWKKGNWQFPNEENENLTKFATVFLGEQIKPLSEKIFGPTIHRVKNIQKERISIFFKLRARPQALGPTNDFDYALIGKQNHIPLKKPIIKEEKMNKQLRNFVNLPLEIFYIIIHYLPLNDILNLRLINKHYLQIIDSNQLWRYLTMTRWGLIAMNIPSWKELYIKRHLEEEKTGRHEQFVSPRYYYGRKTSAKLVVVGDPAVGKTSLLIVFFFDF